MEPKEAVKEYQCSGCVSGPYEKCYMKYQVGVGCQRHSPGTTVLSAGKIFLGMPKGFNRLGSVEPDNFPIVIFENAEQYDTWENPSVLEEDRKGSIYGVFNVPVWKYLNEHGHTIVKGLMPRVNKPFLHVFLKDVRDRVNCLEISDKDIAKMD